MYLSRRILLAGLTAAAGSAAGQTPTLAARQSRPDAVGAAPTSFFSARSTDGTILSGAASGDPDQPEILFIHGLRQSRLNWEKQFADVALEGFRLVAFDLRGHGDSDKPVAPDAYADADLWADDVAAVIAAAKLRRPVVVGWSLGGYVAGAYLRKFGGSAIAGVNLVSAVTKLSEDLLSAESSAFTRSATSPDLAERTAATAKFLAACFHRQPSLDEMQRMLVVNGMAARSVNEGFVTTKTTDLEPVFREFSGPILLTHGVHDRLVRVAMSERITTVHANSRLSLFSDSGHSAFYEEPARYARELAAFARTATAG